MASKICSKCKKEKLFKEFHKNRSTKSGFSSWCKGCCSVAEKKYKENLSPEEIVRNRERRRQTWRRHYKKKYGNADSHRKFHHIRNREDFIKRANERHGGFYSYDKVVFAPRSLVKSWTGEQTRIPNEYHRDTKIIITCPAHGDFLQTARKHIERVKPSGCHRCAYIKAYKTKKEKYPDGLNAHARGPKWLPPWVKKEEKEKREVARKLARLQVLVKKKIIALHTTPESMTERFIEKSISIWGKDKWDYSLVWYDFDLWKNTKLNYLYIGCKEHGFYKQLPTNHYRYGCQKCALITKSEKSREPIESLIKRLKKIHGDKYDYSQLIENWTGSHIRTLDGRKPGVPKRGKKYPIICKIHGVWMVDMNHHLHRASGCPLCATHLNSKGEKMTRQLFEEIFNGYSFDKSRPDWLINPETNCKLELDGYNKQLKLAFEYQGQQHYDAIKLWGGKKNLESIQRRDKIKRKLCKTNGVTLVEIDSRPLRNRTISLQKKLIRKTIEGIKNNVK